MNSRAADFPVLRSTRKLLARGEPPTPVDYASGDDILRVDWARCARHDELVLRRPSWSPRPALRLLIDCSASMGFGEPTKLAFAARLAAALAQTALANGSVVGAAGFSQGFWSEAPPSRTARQGIVIEEWSRSLSPQGANVSVEEFAVRLAAQSTADQRFPLAGALVLILGDLPDPGEAAALAETVNCLGGEPALIQTLDREELTPALRRRVALTDLESGRSRRVRLRREDLEHYRAALARRLEKLSQYCRRRGWMCIAARSRDGIEPALDAIFRAQVGACRTNAISQ